MQTWIPVWLPGETAHASAVDLLFVGLLISSGLVLLLLFGLLLRFAVHYRAGNADADRDHRVKKGWHLEVGWTAATWELFLSCSYGAHSFISTSMKHRRMPCWFMWSPSNGCGRCNILAVSA